MADKDMADKWYEFEEDVAFRCICCIRIILILMISVSGFMLANSLRDSPYRLSEKETGLLPQCVAISHDLSAGNTVEVKFVESLGDVAIGVDVAVTISYPEYQEELNCGEAMTWYPPPSDIDSTFPDFRFSMFFWLVFKFSGLLMDYLKRFYRLNADESKFAEGVWFVAIFIIFSTGAGVIISPIANVDLFESNVADGVAITSFSPKFQQGLVPITAFVVVDIIMLAGCLLHNGEGLPEASSIIGSLFYALCFSALQVWAKAGSLDAQVVLQDSGQSKSPFSDYLRCLAVILAAPAGILVLFILVCVCYQVMQAVTFDMTLLIGLPLSLKFRFPDVALSATVNVFQFFSLSLAAFEIIAGFPLAQLIVPLLARFCCSCFLRRLPDRITGMNSEFAGRTVHLGHKLEHTKAHQWQKHEMQHEVKQKHRGPIVMCHPNPGSPVHACCNKPENSPGCAQHCRHCGHYVRGDVPDGCMTYCKRCNKEPPLPDHCVPEEICTVCKNVKPTRRRCIPMVCCVKDCRSKKALNPEDPVCKMKAYDACSLAEKRRAFEATTPEASPQTYGRASDTE